MERIVYFLGAGFSAPLGLPVMSNFLEKSRDLYFSDANKYKHFAEVLETIAKMSVVKNYYSTDLFNIEEIFSIIAMQQGLKGRRLKSSFLRYIADVINHYTPSLASSENYPWPSNWHSFIFSRAGDPGRFFGNFFANLLHLRIVASQNIKPLRASRFKNPAAEYSIVTLNYDLVPERFAQYVSDSFVDEGFSSFQREPSERTGKFDRGVPLVKLHGSADTAVMVAPTWNKNLASNLLPAWKAAFDLLAKANHIRVIGYSLPTADAYIKYLFRAAAIESRHLKKIDVLCRDDRRSSVRTRYEEFIDFANFRFANCNVVDYTKSIEPERHLGRDPELEFRRLEAAHETFFTEKAE